MHFLRDKGSTGAIISLHATSCLDYGSIGNTLHFDLRRNLNWNIIKMVFLKEEKKMQLYTCVQPSCDDNGTTYQILKLRGAQQVRWPQKQWCMMWRQNLSWATHGGSHGENKNTIRKRKLSVKWLTAVRRAIVCN